MKSKKFFHKREKCKYLFEGQNTDKMSFDLFFDLYNDHTKFTKQDQGEVVLPSQPSKRLKLENEGLDIPCFNMKNNLFATDKLSFVQEYREKTWERMSISESDEPEKEVFKEGQSTFVMHQGLPYMILDISDGEEDNDDAISTI